MLFSTTRKLMFPKFIDVPCEFNHEKREDKKRAEENGCYLDG